MNAGPPPSSSERDGGRLASTFAFGLVLALAAWVRIVRFGSALAGGDLVPVDGDSHYHVRRIEAALAGHLPRFDPLIDWPAGGFAPWADGFDLLGAGFAAIAGGGTGGARTHLAVFVWPVVLGLLAVWATIDLARKIVPAEDRWTPLAAGLVAAVIPQFVAISSFGLVDHHVAEALSMLLLAGWCMGPFPVQGSDPPGPTWEAAGAVLVALTLWVFSGGVLYVALAAVPLGVAALSTGRPARVVGSGAPALVAGALLGALASLPAIRIHGSMVSFVVPSLLQPCLVALAGGALAAAVLAGRRFPGSTPVRRVAVQIGAASAVVILPLLLVPSLHREIGLAVEGWVFRRDPWIATIAEFQPLVTFGSPGGWGFAKVDKHLGPLGVLGAVGLPVGVAVAWRFSRQRALTFAFLAVTLSALALLQIRFARLAGPMLAVGIALALRGLGLALSRARPLRRVAAVAPFAGAAAIVAASPVLRGQLEPVEPAPMLSLHRAALELKLDRPPQHGRHDGVLAPWDVGHAVTNLSGRPVAANGFGTYLDPVSFRAVGDAFLGNEARLVETMDRYDLGFVIGGGFVLSHHQALPVGDPPVVGNPPGLNPAFMKKMALSQLLIAGSGLVDARLPHLERLMPVFASQAVAGNLSFPLPVLWTYELVPGATLTGHAAPGAMVTGEIDLTERGRSHRYQAWTIAGPAGDWKMRVAVPSGLATPTVRTGPAWHITQGDGRRVDVEIPESAVRTGSDVAVR